MISLNTSIGIHAPPEDVWEVLIASPDIPEPIRAAVRERAIGKHLKVRMGAGRGSAMINIRLLAIDRPNRIRWKGYLWVPGLFDGDHSFEILEKPEGGVVFTQREMFSGLLLPLLSWVLADTEKEFHRMNTAIRSAAETAERSGRLSSQF